MHIFRYFLFIISLANSFKPYYKIKYETTQNKIKIYKNSLKSIKYGYLKLKFIL